jgi:hypothetical protein
MPYGQFNVVESVSYATTVHVIAFNDSTLSQRVMRFFEVVQGPNILHKFFVVLILVLSMAMHG